MKKTLKLMNEFEKRNNLSISLILETDGSCTLLEFWDSDVLKEFHTVEEMEVYLKDTQYLLNENGRCVHPVQIVNSFPIIS